MGYSKDQLLERLQELEIEFVRYDHPVVLTVEAQAKYVGHLGGGLSKNLFLKDKKQRFYIITALAGTTVDLKVLSQRLGLGKGGLRMAPEEALQEMLQVPLGCVTPFALINDSARNVSLLLDQGFKAQECCYFHPLSNDITIALTARDLDKFLISIGKDPSYVDLEANPSVGKDQPPDLAALVPSGTTVLTDQPEKVASTKLTTANDVPLENKSKPVTEHDGDDDMWFDEGSQCNDSKEELIGGVLDLDREWWRRHDQFHTIGYRDGLISGKETSAQEGFTIGFKQSVLVGYKFGIIRGVLSALAFLSNDLKEKLVQTPETREKLQLLHKSMHSVSTNDALKLFRDEILVSKPKEHSLVERNSNVTIMPGEISSCSQLESYSLELDSLLQSSAIQVHSAVE